MPGLYGNVGNITISGGNTTGLYSTGSAVVIEDNINVDNIYASGNLVVAGTGTFGGNVTAPNFIGNLTGNVSGNISGNVVAPGSNTQVIYNDSGSLGADADFTWNESTNTLTVNGTVVADDITLAGGNVNANSGYINNLTDPVAAQDAATKAYVDSQLSSSSFDITDGSNTTAVNLGDTVTFSGVANETEVVVGNLSVTIGLPNSVQLGNLTASGNVQGAYILGNGSQLTGLPASYGNANVAAYLPTYTGNLAGGNLDISNNAVVDGNLTVGGTIYGTFSGNITGNLVVPGSNTQVIFNDNGNAGASANLTFNSATDVLTVTGTANVTTLNATGNITAGYFLGNGSQLTGIVSSYGNANVAAYLPTYTGNIGSVIDFANGNIQTSAGYVGVFADLIQIESNAGDLQLYAYNGNVNIQTPTVDITGNTSQTGYISATGNITGANMAQWPMPPMLHLLVQHQLLLQ
jgi:cytoskeletal protein CcmA (bactofilin family)